jgi:phosphoribosylanthranilate isomerase
MTNTRTRVKICGITNLNDAQAAAEAGADMLGFIFYPPSPRFIKPAEAGRIADAIRRALDRGGPGFVGVFVDAAKNEIRQTIAEVHLDIVQLHGSEPPEVVAQFGARAMKAVRPRTPAEAGAALRTYMQSFTQPADQPNLLADAYHPVHAGGTGLRTDVEIAQLLARRCRLMLAGGLTPDNVREAIASVRPWGVDVASGVEQRPGIKDHTRVRAFIEAVRSLEGQNGRVRIEDS